MSNAVLKGNASGTGTVTLETPNTNSDRTISLPDADGTMVYANASGNVGIGTDSPQKNLDVTKVGEPATLRIHSKTDSSPTAKIELMRGLSDTFGDTNYTSYSVRADAGTFRISSANNTDGEIDIFQIASSGNIFSVIDGFDVLVPNYGARAWVNFNGTGTVAIRESGNVSSVTDNGLGAYTVNFSTAMSDVNYAAIPGGDPGFNSTRSDGFIDIESQTTSAVKILTNSPPGTASDWVYVSLAIFR
jgi:hypothetical protein